MNKTTINNYQMRSKSAINKAANKLKSDIIFMIRVLAQIEYEQINRTNSSHGLPATMFAQACFVKKKLKEKYRKGTLTAEQIEELATAGFVFEHGTGAFLRQINLLHEIQVKYPGKKLSTFNPPDKEASAPRQWLLRHLRSAKFRTLNKEQRDMLSAFVDKPS